MGIFLREISRLFIFLLIIDQALLGSERLPLTPPPDPIPPDYFGMHIHRAATTTPWPSVPFGAWRLWDAAVNWTKLEPIKGEWQFTTLDREVELAEEHHVDLLLTLGRTPSWASGTSNGRSPSPRNSGGATPPKRLTDWSNYVRKVAMRYKGHIREYEIWNEPNLQNFYNGTPEQMVALAREAYSIIKQIDPANLVISPSAVGPTGLPWLQAYLRAGGGAYADVIGYHLYVRRDPPEAMVDRVREVKSIMSQNGIAEKPLWNTESGRQRWGGPPIPDRSPEAGAYIARTYILNWAAGVRRFYWYAWDNTGMAIRLTEDERRPTPAARTYADLQHLLVGARMTRCSDDHQIWVCELSRNNTNQWIVWSPDRNTQFRIPEAWDVQSMTDISGHAAMLRSSNVQIGPMPIILVAEKH